MAKQLHFTNKEAQLGWQRQWGRLKRQEKSIFFFQAVAVFFNILLWLTWIFFVAPYPITLKIPFVYFLSNFPWGADYLWPLSITLFLVLNFYLFRWLYRKDIFAAWIILGANLMVQLFALMVGVYLSLL